MLLKTLPATIIALLVIAVVAAAQHPRPVVFTENRGQWDPEIAFTARLGAVQAAFTSQAVAITRTGGHTDRLRGATVRLSFQAGDPDCSVVGVDRQAGSSHFLMGDDPRAWTTGVASFGQLLYRELYAGVQIRFRVQDGQLEYDVELSPEADLEQVVIRCEGVRDLRIDPDGALVMQTPVGAIRQQPPLTWQVAPDGSRRPLTCAYRILDEQRYGFVAAGRRPDLAMVIDPGIEWSTFIGGSRYDYVHDLALDAAGGLTICGYTQSSNFPTTPGAYDPGLSGNVDAFIARFDAQGNSVFTTYFGGSATDYAKSVALTGQGDIVVFGYTESSNLPVTPGAYQSTHRGGGDFFLTRLNAAGAALVYSTYLGGAKYDEPHDLVLDASDAPVVVGLTQSTDFPTSAGAFDTSYGGSGDGAVAKLDAAGAKLVFGTYLGGSGQDAAWAVGLTPAGEPTVAGATFGVNNTTDFPTTAGAFDTTYNGGKNDAFVARLNATATTLVFSTLLGGTNADPIRDLVQHASGEVTVAGQSYSLDFPTTAGAFDTGNDGGGDAFVLRLNATGSKVDYATFIGGTDYDEGTGLAVDAAGAVTITGWTRSTDFPITVGAFQSVNNGNGDAFVARLSPLGDRLHHSTYLGGKAWDYPKAIALDGTNAATIGGETWSPDLPTTPGAPDPSYNSQGDAFVSRLDLLPTGVAKLGASTPSCRGPIALGVDRSPTSPEPAFRFVNLNAPPSSAGVLALGVGPAPSGIRVDKALVYVNPLYPFMVLPVFSNAAGTSTPKVGIPGGIKGVQFYAQIIWSNTASCPGSGALSASNALHLTFQ